MVNQSFSLKGRCLMGVRFPNSPYKASEILTEKKSDFSYFIEGGGSVTSYT